MYIYCANASCVLQSILRKKIYKSYGQHYSQENGQRGISCINIPWLCKVALYFSLRNIFAHLIALNREKSAILILFRMDLWKLFLMLFWWQLSAMVTWNMVLCLTYLFYKIKNCCYWCYLSLLVRNWFVLRKFHRRQMEHARS